MKTPQKKPKFTGAGPVDGKVSGAACKPLLLESGLGTDVSGMCLAGGCGLTSGSGLMAVVPIDRARHRGSNGGCYSTGVAESRVLAVIL
jgi:hypothetical protein